MTDIREMIRVMQAYAEGKRIEARLRNAEYGWQETVCPVWNWYQCDYRIKQEPREFSVVINRHGVPVGVATDVANVCIPISCNDGMLGSTIIKVREVLQ